jgi:hypothetical protein
MLNFYRRFLPGIAHILKPLTDACKGSGSILWTEQMQAAFQSAKSFLASAVLFNIPNLPPPSPSPRMPRTRMLAQFSSSVPVAPGNP